ncbi:uncharacterized protein LOC128681947 [Plodia interpunctella]|uniref:uncharacterized protein LOC128681947 n=1 Tax=Plodia interpunctella TaxID=58824 RepID=UPI002367F88F|nr:uncharacterized protein LOC128681947 [Plodia interpunctella]XP_053622275.1 uncharacterized protein LOC128681947 [Plodia interpunctella]XP_053622276.1 uncharacterized protein LOC128681947 [Plodia interpunctella]
MQRTRQESETDSPKSRPGSRRNSTNQSRRNSIKKEKEKEKVNGSSCTSTPKKVVVKPGNLDFVVTGRQCLKKSDRANSLPGYRRPSVESIKGKKFDSPKRAAPMESQSSKSRETSLEDDMSLDLSQVSDFEDTNSKYGINKKFTALATSTPKSQRPKPRSGSLQSHLHQKLDTRSMEKTLESSKQSRDTSRESIYKTSSSASPYRYGGRTELDYSSVSPECSGLSSADLSPRVARGNTSLHHVSSCCTSSWQDCSELDTAVADRTTGEWSSFWANYNNSVSKVPLPVQSYYDQCPTPYRTENIDLADLEFSTEGSRKRTPENIENINYVIRNEGLNLTPRETQNIIKCAHILGNVLTKAIERRCREKDTDKVHEVKTETEDADTEIDEKKKNLTLELKEKNVPETVVEKTSETVTTQTDISLPNTKSAPKIFEKILRQLSRTSLEEALEKDKVADKVADNNLDEKKDPPKDS